MYPFLMIRNANEQLKAELNKRKLRLGGKY